MTPRQVTPCNLVDLACKVREKYGEWWTSVSGWDGLAWGCISWLAWQPFTTSLRSTKRTTASLWSMWRGHHRRRNTAKQRMLPLLPSLPHSPGPKLLRPDCSSCPSGYGLPYSSSPTSRCSCFSTHAPVLTPRQWAIASYPYVWLFSAIATRHLPRRPIRSAGCSWLTLEQGGPLRNCWQHGKKGSYWDCEMHFGQSHPHTSWEYGMYKTPNRSTVSVTAQLPGVMGTGLLFSVFMIL